MNPPVGFKNKVIDHHQRIEHHNHYMQMGCMNIKLNFLKVRAQKRMSSSQATTQKWRHNGPATGRCEENTILIHKIGGTTERRALGSSIYGKRKLFGWRWNSTINCWRLL
ncbi:hypothetical protein RND81_01G107300 [Saponaria officinalis]|uniref:Uncharacterized protein n=1 Tax=Saponaria officinalis TaxID=3572 RepID=A0AAW1N6X3_SAPOF